MVTVKAVRRCQWLLMPGALTILELNMRQLLRTPSSTASSSKRVPAKADPTPITNTESCQDLVSVIEAHRGLLQRTWIGMMSFATQHDPSIGEHELSGMHMPAVAANTITLAETFCKLLLLAAGLASNPDSVTGAAAAAAASPGQGDERVGAKGAEGVLRDTSLQVEGVACAELQQFV